MKNMLWFLKKHGNKSFEEMPFCEADALVMSEVCYLALENFAKDPNEEIMLKDILNPINAKKLAYGCTTRPRAEKMCIYWPKTTRYDKVYFKFFRNILDNDIEEQFFAVTFFIEDLVYVVYRGTDLTFSGWVENLNMTFLDVVPSQIDAVNYLNEVYSLYKCDLIVGGHSKGGNLALYAASRADDEVRNHITKIYDFDGPGVLDKNFFKRKSFLEISNRLVAVSSTMSVVAMLLYNVKNIEFLKTSGFTVLQHDPFNWHIKDDGTFVRVKRNSISSRYLAKAVDNFFETTTADDRERFTNILVYLTREKPESSLLDIKHHPLGYMKMHRERKKLLGEEDRYFYKRFYKHITGSFKEVLKNQLRERKRLRKALKNQFVK